MILRVAVFYILAFFLLILLGGGSQAIGIPPEIGLAQWGPGIAGLLMLVFFRKDAFRITFINRQTPLLRYVIAAAIPFGVALIVYLITQMIGYDEAAAGMAIANPLLFSLWIPFGALGEEIGWRGYLQKRLDGRLRGIVSSVLVGLLWMPIHVHLFQNGLMYMLLVTVLLIAYSIVIYALTQDTGFSVLLATVFHAAINYSNLLFLDIFNEISFMAVYTGIWVVIAIATILMRRTQFFEPQASRTVTA